MTFTFTIFIPPWVLTLLSAAAFVVILSFAIIGLYALWCSREGL